MFYWNDLKSFFIAWNINEFNEAGQTINVDSRVLDQNSVVSGISIIRP